MASNSPLVIKKFNEIVLDFGNQHFVKTDIVTARQKLIKRLLDIIVALVGILILLPLLIYIVIRIRLDSKGSIFYFQERIGFNGIPFTIFKFRSMYEDSEKNGPTLSSATIYGLPNGVRK